MAVKIKAVVFWKPWLRCSIVMLLFWASAAYAQVKVQLAWDPSATPSVPGNPVNYRLYQCADAELTNCVRHEAGTALTFGPITLAHGSTTWFYVTAWNYDLESETDGETKLYAIQESGKSNILRVRAFAPPGNPKNQRIQVADVKAGNVHDLYGKLVY